PARHLSGPMAKPASTHTNYFGRPVKEPGASTSAPPSPTILQLYSALSISFFLPAFPPPMA
ncbi:MAG: hypothetical protein WC782_16935, partial [Methylococcaceae bacterium]